MSLRTNLLSTGRLSGVVMSFDAGDVLDMHKHGAADVHITIVARGRFRVHGPEIGDRVFAAGAVIDWAVGVEHEFIALDDGSRIVNIVKG